MFPKVFPGFGIEKKNPVLTENFTKRNRGVTLLYHGNIREEVVKENGFQLH